MGFQVKAGGVPRSVKVAIVGGGLGGLCMAVKLREAGIDDFVLLEKAGELGGTWRDNHYPGCACDVPLHLYSYSFAADPDWPRRYGEGREIQRYIRRTASAYGLYAHTRFHAELHRAAFDEETGLWTLHLKDGGRLVCQHWVLARGPLHRPAIPDIPGLDVFQGKVFHSARWDHDYDLRGKRVVSVGTGASAIQYLPRIAAEVARLTVVQRTPAWVVPRDQRAYSARVRRRFRRFPVLRRLHRARLYWGNESRLLPLSRPRLARLLEWGLKRFIRAQVKDPETARRLTPDYRLGCKRIMVSNDYYPIFNRDNVELITEGVREIRAHSIVFRDGSERRMDCLVLGTGFVADPRLSLRDIQITGLAGRRLRDDWKDGAQAYLGMTVAGYPNLFQMVGPNTGLGHNSMLFMIECQAHYIIDVIRRLDIKGAAYVNVKHEAMEAFNRKLQRRMRTTVWQTGGCRSWYQQADGKNVAIWPYASWRYWLHTRRVDERAFEWRNTLTPGAIAA